MQTISIQGVLPTSKPAIQRSYPAYNLWDIVIEISAWVLAISASMILGLLSFSGMLAIMPILPLAFSAFVFAIVIEGEIYLQSIRSALKKLTDPAAYENQLTALYLQEKLKDYEKNRDFFLLKPPTEAQQRQLCRHNQVVVFEQNGEYVIGYAGQDDDQNIIYKEKKLTDQRHEIFSNYAAQNTRQEIENAEHHNQIHVLVCKDFPGFADRQKQQYPQMIDAYLTQCRYLRRLNCYLHTQTQEINEKHQVELANMELHLTKLAQEIQECLFDDTRDKGLYCKPCSSAAQSNPDTYSAQQYHMVQLEHLRSWVAADRATWKENLQNHRWSSRVAVGLAALSGLIMGIGTTYLIMEAVAAIPWLAALSLAWFPPIIAPLALIAGAAYGLLIYNSLTDILLDNPIKKFMDRISNLFSEMTLKKRLILAMSLILIMMTVILTVCSIGTWITVFHQTAALFTWIAAIPDLILNCVIPMLIGLSVLPFSLQSISNTLDNLELNPNFDWIISAFNFQNWFTPSTEPSRSWQQWLFESLLPNILGISAEKFAQETLMQKMNPCRIIYRLLFEPLRNLIFIGHLVSAGATQDQIEGVPVAVSFWLNFWFECAEDWDWIWGREHEDDLDAVELIQARASQEDDHNHDKNVPMRLLKWLFDPVLYGAALWDHHFRDPQRPAEDVQARYERFQGFKPEATDKPAIPTYRKGDDYELFLFKSAQHETAATQRFHACSNC